MVKTGWVRALVRQHFSKKKNKSKQNNQRFQASENETVRSFVMKKNFPPLPR